MKNKYIIFLIAITAIPLLYAFSSSLTVSGAAKDKTFTVSGEVLYQKNCAGCHGVDMTGNPPSIPSLVEVGNRLQKGDIKRLLQSGRNAMPSFNHLSKSERDAIVGYLFGENIQVRTITDSVEQGKRLFIANCSRCHRATPDDPAPPDIKARGMRPAILGGITANYSFNEFKNILEAGPCYMPSFSNMNDKDKKKIYWWLATMEGNFESHGTMSGRCGCRMRCR